MKRLLLLRHAKTVPVDPEIEDRDRELLPLGRENAQALGRYMVSQGLLPGLILCSTSRRTTETTELVVAELPASVPVKAIEALYLAAPNEILKAVRAAPDNVEALLVVGHNPGLERLAPSLARDAVKRKERDRFDQIEEKFPTAALAVLDFDVARWRDVAPKLGRLIDFVRPRDL